MITFSIFLVLITIVCFLLIVVIMVQNPKGGGLSSTFGSSQTMGGVQKTTDFLDKSTWYLGATLIVLILLSNLSDAGISGQTGSKIIDDSVVPTTIPAAPAATPAGDDKTAAPAASETPATEEAKK